MDPSDGAILALVSRPNFDPNIFLAPINPAQWQMLQNKQPFLNRAFNSCYPPGSIFKLVTASAALENGLITPQSSVFCHGYMTFAERRYWCSQRDGHGRLTASQALAKSCNILFYEIAKKINIDVLAQYAHKFGLGRKTNICFSEKEGLIPTNSWKMESKGERWWPGETLSAAIGQSYLLVTPIQVACMISSIFTGYLVTPRILINETLKKQPLEIRHSTLEFLRESMRAVVTKGTGIRVSHVKNIEIYAKTSTAQIKNFKKDDNPEETHQEHGGFVAYFKYKDNKPLTIVITAENAGTSRVATAIAKEFLIEYKKLMDVRSQEIIQTAVAQDSNESNEIKG
jgi:penicillin-binding protein 2